MTIVRLAQAAIVSIPAALFGWLVWQELVPTGVFAVRHAVDERSPFIDRILPDQRVRPIERDADGDWVQPVIGDPAFFFVHPHRGFDTVEAEVWFKNEGVPIVELGGLARTDPEVYDLKPLQNLIIDRLIDEEQWSSREDGGLILLQRAPAYDSVSAFLEDLPDLSSVATYQFDLKPQAAGEEVIPYVLRLDAFSGPVYTDASRLSFETAVSEGVQTVTVGGNRVSIEEPFKSFSAETAEPITRLEIPQGHVLVRGDGLFAFSKAPLLTPHPTGLLADTDLDARGIDYVIARYTPPEQVGDWNVAHVTFDAAILAMQDRTWKFVFSVPGIRELGARLDVGNINMIWKRKPLWP